MTDSIVGSKTIQVVVPGEIASDLKLIADKFGVTISCYVREAIVCEVNRVKSLGILSNGQNPVSENHSMQATEDTISSEDLASKF